MGEVLSRIETYYLLKRYRKRRRSESTVPASPLLDGLVGYWKLDEASGVAADVGGVLNLSAVNNPTGVAGKIGNGRRCLRTSNQYLNVASHPKLALSAFTWAGWVKLTDKFNLYHLAGKSTLTGSQFEWHVFYSSGADRFGLTVSSNGSSTTSVNATALGSPAAGTWYYVVAWHDPVGDQIGIRVNGLVTTATHATGMFNGSSPFALGARGEAASLLNGVLDEVALWSRVLTVEEQAELYNSGNGKTYPFGD